jgi:hypothetical protein
MRCQELQELIPDYLAGEIPSDELGSFHGHLAECESCRIELEQAQSMWRTLGEIPEEEPSPGLRGRFYAMLEDEKRSAMAGPHREPWTTRVEAWINSWWPRRPAVQMAMTVGVLIVGVTAGSSFKKMPQPIPNGEVAQLRGEVEQMHEMVSLSLLGQDSSSERLRGVNWSSRVSEPSPTLLTSLTNTLNSDPNASVRMAAVDALGRFSNMPGVVEVLTGSLTNETSPMVQVALIDLLIAIQEKKALEALKNFVEMQNVAPEVKEHAENRISGTL